MQVRLAGGLGNQIFQLAAALALSKPGTRIRLLTGALARYKTARQPDVIRLLDLPRLGVEVSPSSGSVAWLVERVRAGRLLPAIGVNDRNFAAMVRQPPTVARWTLLDGYFQQQWTWDVMEPVLGRLRDALKPEWKNIAHSECLIHVRGGDFLRSPTHQVLDEDYYRQALTQLRQRMTISSVKVITDDPPYAADILGAAMKVHTDIRFDVLAPKPDPLNDFAQLLHARARIIGNSTFSWWAAALDAGQGLTLSPSLFAQGANRHVALPWEVVLPVHNGALPSRRRVAT